MRTDLEHVPAAGEPLNDFDRKNATTYLRLLDADAAGASWQEAVATLFKLDARNDADRLERLHAAYLARAKWVRDGGYQQLLVG